MPILIGSQAAPFLTHHDLHPPFPADRLLPSSTGLLRSQSRSGNISPVEARSLLAGIPRMVRDRVHTDLRVAVTRTGFGLVKIYYGNAKIHYEANHQPRSKTIEIGLHFEADGITNERLLGAFRVHAREIARELPDARLEPWDKGWARIWEPLPYSELDADLQRRCAERLARSITALEPILRDVLPADVPWDLPPARPRAAAKKRSTAKPRTRRTAERSAAARSAQRG